MVISPQDHLATNEITTKKSTRCQPTRHQLNNWNKWNINIGKKGKCARVISW